MENKLLVSASPHFKSNVTTSSIMLWVIIALVPSLIASVWIFGLRAALLVAVCVASCVVFEYLFAIVTSKTHTISDLSAVVTGMILAFNLPPTLPIWMAVVGSFVAIVIAKQLFGGIGFNFANPAILARIMLLVSFSQAMTSWLVPTMGQNGIDLVSGATPLTFISSGTGLPSYLDMFLGLKGGCIGEVSGLAIAIGFVILLAKRIITPTTPLVFIATVMGFAALIGQDPMAHLLTGGLLFGAVFMATDYSTSPVTESGKIIFAIGCGVLTILIRAYGSYPEGVSFAILLMNILTPHIDSLTGKKAFGGASK